MNGWLALGVFMAFCLLMVAAMVIEERLYTARRERTAVEELQARLEEDYEVAMLESWLAQPWREAQ